VSRNVCRITAPSIAPYACRCASYRLEPLATRPLVVEARRCRNSGS